jgi:hypothetical protein
MHHNRSVSQDNVLFFSQDVVLLYFLVLLHGTKENIEGIAR